MKTFFVVAALFMLLPDTGQCRDSNQTTRLTESSIKKKIIEESIAGYAGNCPCPYSTMRNGRACGGRSAYSRPGGAAPICFENQVSKEMVAQWRQDNHATAAASASMK